MTRVLALLKTVTRSERVLRGCIGLALLAVAWACADKVTGPPVVVPKGHVGVYADMGGTGITTLVIQVSGPGIVKPDASPDTLAFNIPLTNGVASGSLDVPAGPDRVITARAFVGITETHRGTVTANILEGTNPTLHITMAPLVGNLPITVSIGSTIVVVRPVAASKAVGDTLQLTSEIRDFNGTIINAKVRWATLNPNKATVDTNGLVMVKDTGDVQIVGTYGTVGGASKVSGVAVGTVPSSIHLTWNGSVNTSWAEPNNWTPHGLGVARVPALTDSVVIPASAPRMPVLQCVDNNAVRDIVIETGASLGTSCYPLNVYGSAVAHGPIPTVFARPNAKLAGSFSQLYVKGDGVRLIDSATVTYFQSDIPIGTFALNGHKLRSTGDLYIADGTITMVDGDTLIIDGNANWSGDDQNGMLTGGVVIERGNQFYGPRFYATGTNRLVLDRTATGSTSLAGFDYVSSPNNSQIRRLEIKSRDGATICGHIRVTDTLSIVSTGTPSTLSTCSSYQVRVLGPVITGVNTDVATYLWELMHVSGTSLVAGTWHPSYTDFDVASAVVKPGLAYGHMRFFASNSLSGNVASSGFLWVEGTGVEFALNGHKATFAQNLTVRNGGTLKMTNAADSLIVGEYAEFSTDQHGLQKPNLTAGVLSVGAYFDGFGFAAQGTFKVVLSGTSSSTSKYITRVNYSTRPTQSFYDLEVASGATYGLCENVRVDHNTVVRTGGTLQEWCINSNALKTVGDLVGEAGSTIKPYTIVINNPTGTSNVAGTYNATYSDFVATNAPVKAGLGYQNLRFFAPNHLLGATTATGHLYIEGATADLNIDGQTLTVGDYMSLQTGGTLTMANPADVVNVANYATFGWDGSSAELPKLTAGTLRVGGYFDGFGFAAGGTHTVELTGTYPSTQRYITRVNYSTRAAQAFQNLTVTSSGSYGLCEFVAVKGTMTVQTGGTLYQWCTNSNRLRIDNDLVVASGGTFSIYDAVLNNTVGTQNVVGTFTPVYTSITNSAAAGQLKAGLGYTNVQFFTAASLGTNMTVNGDLNVIGAGAVLTLNGKTLTVASDLNLQTNGTLVMNNALDVLDVSGAANWNGGGSEAGKLTAGTTILRGPTFCATNYETSGTHKTEFNRSTSAVKLQCVSSNGANQPMWNVDVKGAGVSLECYMNVTNDIHVFSGASLNETCGSGTLWVGHILTTDAGSAVTNGPSYPSTTKLAVVFEHSSGTQNVAGSYSADQSYFTALNSYIKPTLLGNGVDYKYLRIDQSTTFQDSTEIDGNFDITNTAIVDLGGHPVVVKGGMSLASSARLKMVSANDVLVVAIGDPTASLVWNGADNSTDGTATPILTNGTIYFHGDNFQGTRYSGTAGTPHKFVFAGTSTSGTVSLNGSPTFANLQISNSRPVTNSGTTTVRDQLTLDASRTISGNGTFNLNGALVTAAGSDFSLSSGTVNVNGPNGTSAVSGAFHPTTTVFSSPSPIPAALKAGLGYNAVVVTGPYLLNGSTTFAGSSSITGSGALTMNGQTLNVTGQLDLSSGGVLNMSNVSDALNVTGLLQFQGTAGLSTLSAGTMTVGGNFNNFKTGLHATNSNTLVLNGTSGQDVNTSSGAQELRNVTVSGTGNALFNGGASVTGSFTLSSTTTVTSSGTLSIDGTLTTVAGSAFNPSSLNVSATAGTSGVAGSMSVAGTTTFSGGAQTIKVGTGIAYTNMTIGTGSVASVSGGALVLPGSSTLTINSGGTLNVPSGSSMGIANVSGTLAFLGTSLSSQTLTVNNGGLATATADLSNTAIVDYGRIFVNTGGAMDNGARSAGGFRYKTTGSPSGFQNNNGGFTNISGLTPFANQP